MCTCSSTSAVSIRFAVNDRLSVGVRARRLQYPSVEAGPYVGETLRSHVPNLRLDGSEPVSAWSTPPGTRVTEVGVLVKFTCAEVNSAGCGCTRSESPGVRLVALPVV